ncbi:hypothetical protein EV361DRAFT_874733, partial [Lentinula raphanica]
MCFAASSAWFNVIFANRKGRQTRRSCQQAKESDRRSGKGLLSQCPSGSVSSRPRWMRRNVEWPNSVSHYPIHEERRQETGSWEIHSASHAHATIGTDSKNSRNTFLDPDAYRTGKSSSIDHAEALGEFYIREVLMLMVSLSDEYPANREADLTGISPSHVRRRRLETKKFAVAHLFKIVQHPSPTTWTQGDVNLLPSSGLSFSFCVAVSV